MQKVSKMEQEKPPIKIMIDPSLFLALRPMHRTFKFIKEISTHEGYEFFYPFSLKVILTSNLFIEFGLRKALKNYFIQKAKPSNLLEIREVLLKEYSDLIKPFKPEVTLGVKYKDFYFSLQEKIKFKEKVTDQFLEDKITAQILSEEWIFLQENSWLVSRTKKIFNKFIDSGAACLQLGRKSVKKIIRKTLKKDESQDINTFDILRASFKWIAVGGSPALSLINPLSGVIVSTASGFFLLFDP